MSFKPLLDPASVDNKTLDLYCNSITTATGGSAFVSNQPHTGLGGYMGDMPANANLNIVLDQHQLIRQDGKYAQITGSCVIQITDINYSSFRIVFDNPLTTIDTVYMVGGSATPPATLNGLITASSVGVGLNSQIVVRFDHSTGSVFPASPTNLTLTYSIVMLLA